MADKYRIGKVSTSIAVAHAAQSTFSNANVPINGLLHQFKVKSGAVDGAATITLNLKDSDGDTVYTKAAIAGNTTAITLLTGDTRVPLSGNYTVEVVFSANQTVTDNTVVVTLIMDRG